MSGVKLPTSIEPNDKHDRDDDGFLNDTIGSAIMNRESAKNRARAENGKDGARLKESLEPGRKVEKAQRFRNAQEQDSLLKDAAQRGPGQNGGKGDVNQPELRKAELSARTEYQATEEKAAQLLGELSELQSRIADILGKSSYSEVGEDGLPEGLLGNKAGSEQLKLHHERVLKRLQARLKITEAQAKQLLQQLLAGSLGMVLVGDPRIAFRRLFERMKKWPKRAKPGRKPESDDEFDALIAWIFEPPSMPDEDELAYWAEFAEGTEE